MTAIRPIRWRAACALVLMLTACTADPPFIYKDSEFARDREDFRKDPPDLTTVIVCYGKKGATPEAVMEIARNECGRFGKVPRFDYQDYRNCPMLTPVSAHYNCVAP